MNELLRTICEEKEYLMRKHLGKWQTNAYKIALAQDRLDRLDSMMISFPISIGSIPVQGGKSAKEDKLIAIIDDKTLIEKGYKEGTAYFEELRPAWSNLTRDEQNYLLYLYINKDAGIEKVMREYHLEKSQAYERCKGALRKLAGMFI